MNYVISLVPIFLYLVFIRVMDGFSLAKWQRIVECFVWGLLSCLICMVAGIFLEVKAGNLFPIAEEIVKGLPLAVAIYKDRSAFFTETLTYGAAVGAGFSSLENILYIFDNPGFLLGDAALRGISTSLIHIGCTSLFATLILVFSRIVNRKKCIVRMFAGMAAILPPIVIHCVYDLFLLPEYIQMAVVVIIFIDIFILIYRVDEDLIHKWLDMCISNDIALFSSIKRGEFQSSNAGQYLMMAKERFHPDVFFDICVYLGLYLELSIAAKSRMILKESGIKVALSAEERSANREKLLELRNLRKSIGTAGILLLNPFINEKAVDKWAMSELL